MSEENPGATLAAPGGAGEKRSAARLGALDGLRGLAALGVVFWHYQHFGGDAKAYPYRTFFPAQWAYERGWVLVDFFFLLSGCVFTHKYLAAVSERRVGGREFFVLRLSRIYPLHVATLVIVAGIQWWRLAHARPALLYQNNDLYHFVLNLLFLQAGWFEQGFQYNNPSWSVAAEVFVYFVFFWLASQKPRRYVSASIGLALFALGVYKLGWNYPVFNELIGRGVLGFFLGSLLFLGLRRIEGPAAAPRVGFACAVVLGGIALMARAIGYDAFIGGSGFRIVPSHVLVLFPLVLTIALSVPLASKALSLRPLTFLGDLSFTIYLLHVPLQMGMLSYFEQREVKPPSSNIGFFWTFFGFLFVASLGVHKLIEIPLRSWMRAKLLAPRAAG